MGTDIHYQFEKKNIEDKWEQVDVPQEWDDEKAGESNYLIHRNYLLFAVLADVRNGYGVAGSETHKPIEPISTPKGFPPDTNIDTDYTADYWLGDHSFSHLMIKEIIDYFDTERLVHHTGIISKDAYEKWDKKSAPDFYSTGLWGTDDVVVADDDNKPEHYTHVRIRWDAPINEDLSKYVQMFKDMYEEYGDLRMVFGFDS